MMLHARDLTRLYVLVEAEQIGRVVSVLQRRQSRVFLGTVDRYDPFRAIVGLPP